jgi:hypothetical protein
MSAELHAPAPLTPGQEPEGGPQSLSARYSVKILKPSGTRITTFRSSSP